MKIYLAILICCFLCTQLSYGQTYSSEINDTEIYDFLNWLARSEKNAQEPKLKRKHVSLNIRPWYKRNLIKVEPKPNAEKWYYIFSNSIADSIFSPNEKDYLIKQVSCIKDSVWHTAFNKTVLIDEEREPRGKGINHYSIPLFSKDRSHVLISHMYFSGDLNVYSGFRIYKRTGKNKWTFIPKSELYSM